MSYITYTCGCRAQAKVYQYNLDGPYRAPQRWTQERMGGWICPECSQDRRDATGFKVGDRVRWEASSNVEAGEGVVRNIAIHRYGRIDIIVQSDPTNWRTMQSVRPDQVHRLAEPKTVAEKLDAAQDGQEFAAVLNGLFTALERARDNEEEEK